MKMHKVDSKQARGYYRKDNLELGKFTIDVRPTDTYEQLIDYVKSELRNGLMKDSAVLIVV